jgi:hypothetical protein
LERIRLLYEREDTRSVAELIDLQPHAHDTLQGLNASVDAATGNEASTGAAHAAAPAPASLPRSRRVRRFSATAHGGEVTGRSTDCLAWPVAGRVAFLPAHVGVSCQEH